MKYVSAGDGTRIAFEDLKPQESVETVVMLHGWPLNHTMFEYQIKPLLAIGVRCVIPDFRGFGASDVSAGGYSYEQMARDVNRVVSALGLARFSLAGFSMGGAVALKYASMYRGKGIRRLALLAAATPSFTTRPGFPYGTPHDEVDAILAGIEADRPKAVADFGKNFFGRQPSPEMMEYFTGVCWEASWIGTYKALIALRDEDLREDMRRVSVPTAIFHGKLDKICPFGLALETHRGIAGSELHAFEESGHAVFYDELELFNKRFVEYIAPAPGSRAG